MNKASAFFFVSSIEIASGRLAFLWIEEIAENALTLQAMKA